MFEDFWDGYAYKTGKLAATKAWEKMTRDEQKLAVLAAPCHASMFDSNEFRKHPATWLNGKCWEDELQTVSKRQFWKCVSCGHTVGQMQNMSRVCFCGNQLEKV